MTTRGGYGGDGRGGGCRRSEQRRELSTGPVSWPQLQSSGGCRSLVSGGRGRGNAGRGNTPVVTGDQKESSSSAPSDVVPGVIGAVDVTSSSATSVREKSKVSVCSDLSEKLGENFQIITPALRQGFGGNAPSDVVPGVIGAVDVSSSWETSVLENQVQIQENPDPTYSFEDWKGSGPQEMFAGPDDTKTHVREVEEIPASNQSLCKTQFDETVGTTVSFVTEITLEPGNIHEETEHKAPRRRRRVWKTYEDIPKGNNRPWQLPNTETETAQRSFHMEGVRIHDTSEETESTSEHASDSGLQENWTVLKQMFRQMFQTADTTKGEDETYCLLESEKEAIDIHQKAGDENGKETSSCKITGSDRYEQNEVETEYEAYAHTIENEDLESAQETYRREEDGKVEVQGKRSLVRELIGEEPDATGMASDQEGEDVPEVFEDGGSKSFGSSGERLGSSASQGTENKSSGLSSSSIQTAKGEPIQRCKAEALAENHTLTDLVSGASVRKSYLLILLFLLCLAAEATNEPYQIFYVDSAWNFFILHPWEFFPILFLRVVAPICLFVAIIIYAFKHLRHSRHSPEQKKQRTKTRKKPTGPASVHKPATEFNKECPPGVQPKAIDNMADKVLSREREKDLRDGRVRCKIGELVINRNMKLSKDIDGNTMLVGYRDNRTVMVKEVVVSVTTMEIVEREMKNHYAVENDANNVLRFYGLAYKDNYIYMSFQFWVCTVRGLITYCSSGGTNRRFICENEELPADENKELPADENKKLYADFLQKFKEKSQLWDANNHPSSLLRDLIKELIKGVDGLHKCKMLHRNINPDSLVIISKQNGELGDRIGDLSMSKKLGEKDDQWKGKYPAPELLVGRRREDLDNDLFSLGCVFTFMTLMGVNLYKNDVAIERDEKKTSVFNDLNKASEVNNLILGLVERSRRKRLDAKVALAHPWFWSYQTKAAFLTDVSQRFASVQQSVSNAITARRNAVYTQRSWLAHLPQAFSTSINIPNPQGVKVHYDTKRLRCLVRLVRDIISHRRQLPSNIEAIVGRDKETIIRYFEGVFPHLLMEVHKIVKDNYMQETDFKSYFEP